MAIVLDSRAYSQMQHAMIASSGTLSKSQFKREAGSNSFQLSSRSVLSAISASVWFSASERCQRRRFDLVAGSDWHSASLAFQIISNCGELLKCSFQILHNLGRNHIGVWEIGAIFVASCRAVALWQRRIVFELEDVEVGFVAQTQDASRLSNVETRPHFSISDWLIWQVYQVAEDSSWSRAGKESKDSSEPSDFSFFCFSQAKPFAGVITAISISPPTPGMPPGAKTVPSENLCMFSVVLLIRTQKSIAS